MNVVNSIVIVRINDVVVNFQKCFMHFIFDDTSTTIS